MCLNDKYEVLEPVEDYREDRAAAGRELASGKAVTIQFLAGGFSRENNELLIAIGALPVEHQAHMLGYGEFPGVIYVVTDGVPDKKRFREWVRRPEAFPAPAATPVTPVETPAVRPPVVKKSTGEFTRFLRAYDPPKAHPLGTAPEKPAAPALPGESSAGKAPGEFTRRVLAYQPAPAPAVAAAEPRARQAEQTPVLKPQAPPPAPVAEPEPKPMAANPVVAASPEPPPAHVPAPRAENREAVAIPRQSQGGTDEFARFLERPLPGTAPAPAPDDDLSFLFGSPGASAPSGRAHSRYAPPGANLPPPEAPPASPAVDGFTELLGGSVAQQPDHPRGATGAFATPSPAAPPARSGPSEYTCIIAAPRPAAVAPRPAAPAASKPAAAAPKATTSYLPLILILGAVFLFAVILIVVLATKG
jgi:hypothetical protein